MNAKSKLSYQIGIGSLIILAMLTFIMAINGPIALALPSTKAADKVKHGEPSGLSNNTLFLPIILTVRAVVLCDGQVYDGYTKTLFVLETEQDKDPTIQKVIRDCTFRNSAKAPITIRDAQNVLIIGNTFDNIRTNIAGVDVHAIGIPCKQGCNIDNVTIRNNSFRNIGADGIQLGTNQRTIKNVFIENNTFQGSDTTGENGVDIKGVDGPIYIRSNSMFGFRPCESASQDCSGSGGAAMNVQSGNPSGPANNIILEGNRFYDSIYGLVIQQKASNIIVRNNQIFNNLSVGLLITGAVNVTVEGNSFSNNPENMKVKDCENCIIN